MWDCCLRCRVTPDNSAKPAPQISFRTWVRPPNPSISHATLRLGNQLCGLGSREGHCSHKGVMESMFDSIFYRKQYAISRQVVRPSCNHSVVSHYRIHVQAKNLCSLCPIALSKLVMSQVPTQMSLFHHALRVLGLLLLGRSSLGWRVHSGVSTRSATNTCRGWGLSEADSGWSRLVLGGSPGLRDTRFCALCQSNAFRRLSTRLCLTLATAAASRLLLTTRS